MPRVRAHQVSQNLYNHEYRQGKESQYTYENVCIVPGGRAGMSRIAAVIVSWQAVCCADRARAMYTAVSTCMSAILCYCSRVRIPDSRVYVTCMAWFSDKPQTPRTARSSQSSSASSLSLLRSAPRWVAQLAVLFRL